ncbi:hypothetical protein CDAR_68111 [Caerostris darwini]|uniref:Uncharacterized protein n=1 Tax=Caerostris darwini TaxID=1538125 RepID=A0AAV4VRK0_9ARAC|nr:hypothetical protein CDAR_68111 [Caerostris darwini]
MGSQTSSNCAEVTLRLPLLNREEGSPSTTTQEVKRREREKDQCFATQLFTNIRYDSVPTLKVREGEKEGIDDEKKEGSIFCCGTCGRKRMNELGWLG